MECPSVWAHLMLPHYYIQVDAHSGGLWLSQDITHTATPWLGDLPLSSVMLISSPGQGTVGIPCCIITIFPARLISKLWGATLRPLQLIFSYVLIEKIKIHKCIK